MVAKRTSIRSERNIRRKVGVRPVRESFLIVCEGQNTEPEYFEMLTKFTGMPYSKKAGVASALYNLLFPRLDTAISNAKTVLADFQGAPPAKCESATTVYALAERLKSYM